MLEYQRVGERLAHQLKHIVYGKRLQDMVYYGYLQDGEDAIISNLFMHVEYFLIENTIKQEFAEHPFKQKRILDTFYREVKEFYKGHLGDLLDNVGGWDAYLEDIQKRNEAFQEALYLSQSPSGEAMAEFFLDSLTLQIPRFSQLTEDEEQTLIKYFHYFITQYVTLILYNLIDHKVGQNYEINQDVYSGVHPKYYDLGNEVGDIICDLTVDYQEHHANTWEEMGFTEELRANIFTELMAGYMLYGIYTLAGQIQEIEEGEAALDSFREKCYDFIDSRIQSNNPRGALQIISSYYSQKFFYEEEQENPADSLEENEEEEVAELFQFVEEEVLENINKKIMLLTAQELTPEQKEFIQLTMKDLSAEIEERVMISFIILLQADTVPV